MNHSRITAIWEVLKGLAPYAVIELLLPGGTILAILCWLYRKRQGAARAAARPIEVTSG